MGRPSSSAATSSCRSLRSWMLALLLLASAPTASRAQTGSCGVNVYSYAPTSYTLTTYDGGDGVCWVPFGSYDAVPRTQNGDVQVWCNDPNSCQVALPTGQAGCPTLNVPCNQWVNLYQDGRGNLRACYAAENGCYFPGTRSLALNGPAVAGNDSTRPKQQPPSLLLRGRRRLAQEP